MGFVLLRLIIPTLIKLSPQFWNCDSARRLLKESLKVSNGCLMNKNAKTVCTLVVTVVQNPFVAEFLLGHALRVYEILGSTTYQIQSNCAKNKYCLKGILHLAEWKGNVLAQKRFFALAHVQSFYEYKHF